MLLLLLFSEVKADRTFFANSRASAESISINLCSVNLGHSLGLRVNLESVEDRSALTCLRALGCDEAQGYFTSRPLPTAERDT